MLVDSSLVSRKFYFYFLPWNWFRTKPVIDTATKIRQMLEDLGPIFVKLGQVISTRKDLLSPEIAYELSKLQDRVKPFPSGISESIITSELIQNQWHLHRSRKYMPRNSTMMSM